MAMEAESGDFSITRAGQSRGPKVSTTAAALADATSDKGIPSANPAVAGVQRRSRDPNAPTTRKRTGPKSSPGTKNDHPRRHRKPSVDDQGPYTEYPSCCSRRWECRGGIALVFTLLATLQVAVACILIWYISYSAMTSTVDRLTQAITIVVLR